MNGAGVPARDDALPARGAAVLTASGRGRRGLGNAVRVVSPRAFWESQSCLPASSTESVPGSFREGTPSFPGKGG